MTHCVSPTSTCPEPFIYSVGFMAVWKHSGFKCQSGGGGVVCWWEEKAAGWLLTSSSSTRWIDGSFFCTWMDVGVASWVSSACLFSTLCPHSAERPNSGGTRVWWSYSWVAEVRETQLLLILEACDGGMLTLESMWGQWKLHWKTSMVWNRP